VTVWLAELALVEFFQISEIVFKQI